MATGNENAGLSLFIQDDRLVFDYNIFGDHHVLESKVEVPTGDVVVGVRFRRGKNDADVALVINDAEVATLHLPLLMRFISSTGMSIGHDRGSAVSTRYEGRFDFDGVLERVDIQLVSSRDGGANEEGEVAAREGMARQ
jgi:arylsulfatase